MRKLLSVALLAAPSVARSQMAQSIKPERYRLTLAIELKQGTFHGHETIEAVIPQPTQSIRLHAIDLQVQQAKVGKVVATVTADVQEQTIALTFPSALAAGPIALEITYQGKLSNSLRGLYAAKVGNETYAFTQMEPTDARRMFPCVDEPAAKARFSLSVSIDQDLQVISNGALLRVNKSRGKRTFHFAETPRMSPYLVALAVARFGSKSTRTSSGVPVAVHALPDKVGLLDYALETAAELLVRLEQYFGIPYPYGKLDLVAVPEFEAGAMENAGAIFFRESLLLADPKQASAYTRRTIAIILAHEMAHQWFGNLVTMAWWDDLWLNEAFATWMEYKVVSAWKPEWNLWMDFQQMKRGPMGLDALATARPIRAAANTPAEINEMFDPITYSKGASVLRMLELYLGEEKFRAGVQRYLKVHYEDNAKAADLWAALEQASGRPVTNIAPGWIDQPGFPLLRVALRQSGKETHAVVEQSRHFARKQQAREDHSQWTVPVCLKYGASAGAVQQRELLSSGRAEWKIGASDLSYIFPNAGQGGYFRTVLEPRWLKALATHLQTALLPEERIGLLDDQWALVESGDITLPDFLGLLAGFRDEKMRPVLESISEKLSGIRKRYVAAQSMTAYERFVETTMGPAFADLGWDAGDDDEERRLSRATVVGALGAVARAPDVLAEAERRAARFRADPKVVDPTMASTLVHLAAIRGDARLYDDYFSRMKSATDPEERERYLHALGRFEKPELIERTLAASLGPDVRKQDSGRVVAGVLSNVQGRTQAWSFVRKNFDALKDRASQFGIERVVRGLSSLCNAQSRLEIAEFFHKHPVEETKRAVAETLEAIDLCIEVREREEKRLSAWLDHFQAN